MALVEGWFPTLLPQRPLPWRRGLQENKYRLGGGRIDLGKGIPRLHVPLLHDKIGIFQLNLHGGIGRRRLTWHEAPQKERRTAVTHKDHRGLLFMGCAEYRGGQLFLSFERPAREAGPGSALLHRRPDRTKVHDAGIVVRFDEDGIGRRC